MLRRIIVLVTFLLVVAGAIFQSSYLNKVFGDMGELFETLYVQANEEDFDSARITSRQILDMFEISKPILNCLMLHSDINMIETEFYGILADIEQESNVELSSNIAHLRMHIRQLQLADLLTTENVF